MIEGLLMGLTNVVAPANLIMLIGGTLLGLVVGALPGFTGVMAVALLIPLTFGMSPITAFVLFTTVYAVSAYSGSITAILFKAPGTSEAAPTVLDGYEMTKKGKASEALGCAAFSSFLGGTLGALLIMVAAPFLASIAIRFGSREMFALVVFALIGAVSLGSQNILKGLLSATFGLLLATVGLDGMTAVPRFTFGIPVLMGGIHFVPAILGLFGIAEVLRMVQGTTIAGRVVEKTKSVLPNMKTLKKLLPVYLVTIPVGMVIGILPGVGATTASFVGYVQAAKWSKHPEKFGTGIIDGVAAPESANNAAAMTSFIPTLALGIPGSATTAVMLGSFIMFGLRPGPRLIVERPDLFNTIIVTGILANVLIIIVAPLFIRWFARFLQIPKGALAISILLLCTVGVFALRNNPADIWVLFIFGLIGYMLEKYKFPIAPIIIGLVLGGFAEQEFRRALVIFGGDLMAFFASPISAAFLGMSILLLIQPVWSKLWRRRHGLAVSKH